ncbi:YciI-like protein [Sulfitobacter sp. THAF37]|uniref:YciI family protein n=1 Tax=Sulfitobacter sp. THAF37 TaxID=2587855 RepID=UPI0012690E77|nr:YciI family protein [Sulfitobacter sp. THAF37]QFT58298.1 YciI-like protein [Sulfitobacter sp. THAF37]
MFVVLIAKDKPGAQDIRAENRPAHLEYLKSTDMVAQAGPLLNEDEAMIGSLIVLDVPDMAAAEAWAANDPYAKAGLFADVSLTHWNRVIG